MNSFFQEWIVYYCTFAVALAPEHYCLLMA